MNEPSYSRSNPELSARPPETSREQLRSLSEPSIFYRQANRRFEDLNQLDLSDLNLQDQSPRISNANELTKSPNSARRDESIQTGDLK
jgi:hypothetical protein